MPPFDVVYYRILKNDALSGGVQIEYPTVYVSPLVSQIWQERRIKRGGLNRIAHRICATSRVSEVAGTAHKAGGSKSNCLPYMCHFSLLRIGRGDAQSGHPKLENFGEFDNQKSVISDTNDRQLIFSKERSSNFRPFSEPTF